MSRQETKLFCILTFITISMVFTLIVFCKQNYETEQKIGGSFANCVELGYERSMCKRVFEF